MAGNQSPLFLVLAYLIGMLGRVERLEAENAYLRDEVQALRARLRLAGPTEEDGWVPGNLENSVVSPNQDRVSAPAARAILTRGDLRRLERENIRRALEASGWRVSGPRGAAALLGMKPTTLASRIRALGVARRPRGRVQAIPEL